MNHPLPVLFVSPSLQAGGAERHLVRLLGHLDRRHVAPSLALHRAGGAFMSAVPADVPTSILQASPSMPSFWRMLRSVGPLRRHIERTRPAAICALQNHAAVATLLACRRLRQDSPPPVAVVVQNNLSQKFKGHRRRPTAWLLAALMRRTYPHAAKIVAASHGVADDVRQRFPHLETRLEVIYNAGFDPQQLNQAQEALPTPPPGPLLVACGRLIEQKGFDLLLQAVARLPSHLSPHLWILGEGPQRRQLTHLIQHLGLTDRVWLAGFQADPRSLMGLADVFVLSSRWEGFGNVMVEAMACGTPVVAFDCPYGPREILDDGKAGVLVPPANAEALAQAITQLLERPDEAHRLAQQGLVRSKAFSPQRAAEGYGDMLQRLYEATLCEAAQCEATQCETAP